MKLRSPRPLNRRSTSLRDLRARSTGAGSLYHRRPRFECLEDRRLLTDVSGYVSGTWNLAGSPYVLVGSVTVTSGTTLNIEPGVEVNTPDWPRYFNVKGTMNATGARFTGNNTEIVAQSGGEVNLTGDSQVAGDRVTYETGSRGSVLDSSFSSAQLQVFSETVTIERNTFSDAAPAKMNASCVPKLYTSTFTSQATIEVEGEAASNATWLDYANIQRYQMTASLDSHRPRWA